MIRVVIPLNIPALRTLYRAPFRPPVYYRSERCVLYSKLVPATLASRENCNLVGSLALVPTTPLRYYRDVHLIYIYKEATQLQIRSRTKIINTQRKQDSKTIDSLWQTHDRTKTKHDGSTNSCRSTLHEREGGTHG